MNGFLKVFILSLCFLISGTGTAHAYLDPGTGNALVYVVISLIGAVAYAVKSAFYKIVRWKKTAVSMNPSMKKEKKKEK